MIQGKAEHLALFLALCLHTDNLKESGQGFQGEKRIGKGNKKGTVKANELRPAA